MTQIGFFDVEKRYAALTDDGHRARRLAQPLRRAGGGDDQRIELESVFVLLSPGGERLEPQDHEQTDSDDAWSMSMH